MEQKEIIKSLEQQLKRKIIGYEEVQDNEIFKKLLENIDAFVDAHNANEVEEMQLKLQSFQIITVVDLKMGSNVKLHNCITLILPDESLIRFSSHGIDGVDLTRIWVKEMNHKKGKGTYLMNTLFKFMEDTVGFIPTIFLECTGEVGVGENAISTNISAQTKFFRKFGFRVKDRSQYPHYVNMLRENSKTDSLTL
jgi:hypothetical protein